MLPAILTRPRLLINPATPAISWSPGYSINGRYSSPDSGTTSRICPAASGCWLRPRHSATSPITELVHEAGAETDVDVEDVASRAVLRWRLAQGSQRYRGDRICRDRSDHAGDVLWHRRIFVRGGDRSQNYADGAYTCQSDVSRPVGQ